MMNDVIYQNISKCLESYWEKSWGRLPKKQRQAWHEVIWLIADDEEMDGKVWDSRDSQDKKRMAEEHDYYHDPTFENDRFVDDCNRSIKAKAWFDMENIEPREAAMLLCRINPLKNEDPERIFVDDNESSPDWYRLLLRTFEDKASVLAEHRTLMQWRLIAQECGLRYHSWIDEYVRAAGVKGAKKKRINQNRAFLQECIKDGIESNIESVWLHIQKMHRRMVFCLKPLVKTLQ